jgi:hypothetical protein
MTKEGGEVFTVKRKNPSKSSGTKCRQIRETQEYTRDKTDTILSSYTGNVLYECESSNNEIIIIFMD